MPKPQKDLLAPKEPSKRQPSIVLSGAKYRKASAKAKSLGLGPMTPGENLDKYWERVLKLLNPDSAPNSKLD
jgi:hypothetical protein